MMVCTVYKRKDTKKGCKDRVNTSYLQTFQVVFIDKMRFLIYIKTYFL